MELWYHSSHIKCFDFIFDLITNYIFFMRSFYVIRNCHVLKTKGRILFMLLNIHHFLDFTLMRGHQVASKSGTTSATSKHTHKALSFKDLKGFIISSANFFFCVQFVASSQIWHTLLHSINHTHTWASLSNNNLYILGGARKHSNLKKIHSYVHIFIFIFRMRYRLIMQHTFWHTSSHHFIYSSSLSLSPIHLRY